MRNVGVHIVTRRVTSAPHSLALFVKILQSKSDSIHSREDGPQQTSDENEGGGAEHVQPQRPARRRRARYLQLPIHAYRRPPRRCVEYRHAGAEAARAYGSNNNEHNDNEEQHGSLAEPLHDEDGGAALPLLLAKREKMLPSLVLLEM